MEKGWTVPRLFEAIPSSSDYEPDPTQRPAAAMLSLIQQAKEWEGNEFATTSQTQIFSQWLQNWNPEMLSTGIEMLGDDEVKEVYRRVLVGDIERWFGNGTHLIGTGRGQVPPGIYRVTAPDGRPIIDGYWERTSASGDIIANNFVSSAQEVTVTIAASDGQFKSTRMGTWKLVT